MDSLMEKAHVLSLVHKCRVGFDTHLFIAPMGAKIDVLFCRKNEHSFQLGGTKLPPNTLLGE